MTIVKSQLKQLHSELLAFGQECQAQSIVVDWFSRFFIAPPLCQFIEGCQTTHFYEFLKIFGASLKAQELTNIIARTIKRHSSEELERLLNQQYVALFDGPKGLYTVYPYESYYCDVHGRLFQQPYIEMLSLMEVLDVSVMSSCKEPPDHLAIELATLAEALRQENITSISLMKQRLIKWVPKMNEILQQIGSLTFYAPLLELLIIYLSSLDLHVLFEKPSAQN